MKLLETKEGIANFFMYKGEEVFVYKDKAVMGDKVFPAQDRVRYFKQNGVFVQMTVDKENKFNYSFSRYNGTTFAEDNFPYRTKKYLSPQKSYSYEFKKGIERISINYDGEEFAFEVPIRGDVLNCDNENGILLLRSILGTEMHFFTKTGEQLWEYTVKEGYEINESGVTIVDDIVVIPCKEDGHAMSVEGYRLLTGEKLWEVNGVEYCNYAYVMGPNKMLYALHSYYCRDHRVELHLNELNPFTGVVNQKVIKEGDYWGDIHTLDTTIHGNKLFYVNHNKEIGCSLGVVDLDTKEVIEDFALEAKGYHVEKPVVTDEKIYVRILHDEQNELRIYENEYK